MWDELTQNVLFPVALVCIIVGQLSNLIVNLCALFGAH